MALKLHVKGKGTFEFPDSMSIEEADKVLRKSFPDLLQEAQPPEETKKRMETIMRDADTSDIGDALYAAINSAEMTGFEPEDQWIRTTAYGSSSSAYGPVQITKSLAHLYAKNRKDLFDEDELAYLNRFVEQGNKFLKYGTQQPVKNDPNAQYNYGGKGDLHSDADREMYKKVAKKMLEDVYQSNGGDLDKTWREWRFGKGSMKNDKRYEKHFKTAMGSFTLSQQQQPTQTENKQNEKPS